MRALKDYLPEPPAKILDIGGGPGRYAITLSRKGFSVTLADLSKKCLELAKEKADEEGIRLVDYLHANATDLRQIQGEDYNAVLLFGPLYHLLLEEDREKAIQEAKRVLKLDGIIFASFISRYSQVRWAAKNKPEWIIEDPRPDELITKGAIIPRDEKDFGAYCAHPSETKPFMEKAGFETLDLISCEGVISMIEEKINELTGDLWERWVEMNYRLGKDPTGWGAADHLLYVGRKRGIYEVQSKSQKNR